MIRFLVILTPRCVEHIVDIIMLGAHVFLVDSQTVDV